MLEKRLGFLPIIALIGLLLIAGCTQLAPLETSAGDEETAAAANEDEAADSMAETASDDGSLLPSEGPPFRTDDWSTDFSKRTVEWSSILSGGPPKDGIQKGI